MSTTTLDQIRARGALRVGYLADSLPYAFFNARGDLVGFDVEMAHQLASDLGVRLELVRFDRASLATAESTRRPCDLIMSGAAVTPNARRWTCPASYLDETLAFLVPTTVGRVPIWESIRALGPIVLGVQDCRTTAEIRRRLPGAQLQCCDPPSELLARHRDLDAYVLPAERGSVLTMLYPQSRRGGPRRPAQVKVPLAYALAGADPAWTRFVNTWVELKRRDGLVGRLYDHWILGRTVAVRAPRWSVGRDVLQWWPSIARILMS